MLGQQHPAHHIVWCYVHPTAPTTIIDGAPRCSACIGLQIARRLREREQGNGKQ